MRERLILRALGAELASRTGLSDGYEGGSSCLLIVAGYPVARVSVSRGEMFVRFYSHRAAAAFGVNRTDGHLIIPMNDDKAFSSAFDDLALVLKDERDRIGAEASVGRLRVE